MCHRQGSYHMECTACAIWVFLPDEVHTPHTGQLPHGVQGLCLMGFLSAHAPYRAATTWTARLWVFCPDSVYTTYRAATTWTARLWVFCPDSVHTTDRATTTWTARLWVFCPDIVRVTYRAYTTWSARPVPRGSSVQTGQNENERCFC